jgi:hypothetical protein
MWKNDQSRIELVILLLTLKEVLGGLYKQEQTPAVSRWFLGWIHTHDTKNIKDLFWYMIMVLNFFWKIK